jgi:hypothetical protein
MVCYEGKSSFQGATKLQATKDRENVSVLLQKANHSKDSLPRLSEGTVQTI